ncbi:MAG TPA: hypothetical protein G4O18_01830 [Dehalococcoidia bacterium]|nr:hypothetical protein [Dehalococcoidia bacterium]
MQVLKVIGLSFLSFILFILLVIFSIAFMANGTFLNPKFITREIDSIDISAMAIEIMEEEFEDDTDIPEELKTALYDTIEDTEPVIKAELNEAIISVGNYLRGKTDEPELLQVLGNTFLNEDFLADLLAEVDIPAVVEASIDTDEIDEELVTSLIDTVSEIEPELKEQVAAASGPVFDYILAETDSIDLEQTLRDTLLNTDFTTSLVDNLDISPIASEFLEDEINEIVPVDLYFITDELDDAVAIIEPTLRQALSDNTDEILDYLLGDTSSISVEVPLEPVRDDLEDVLEQIVLDNIPTEWEGLSQAEIDQRIDDFLTDAMDAIPDTFELDEELLGSELPEQITDGLTEAEETLTDVREDFDEKLSEAEDVLEKIRGYVGWFITGYWILITVIILIILAIIAIYHQVKGASLHLGIMFLVLGIIECIAVFVGRGIGSRIIAEQDIAAAVQHLPDQLIAAVTGPLAALSVGLIVLGVILIAASILYPRLRPAE